MKGLVSNKVILVDVDGTVVDTATPWLNWLKAVTSVSPEIPENFILYNLGDYFDVELEELGIDPMDYWRDANIYDCLTPIQDSVANLYDLHNCGFDIVFASHCKGYHQKSKVRFLKKYFPFMKGFAATKEKNIIHCDIIVDDRHNFLNQMPDNVQKILFETPYLQTNLLKNPEKVYKACSWWDVKSKIINSN